MFFIFCLLFGPAKLRNPRNGKRLQKRHGSPCFFFSFSFLTIFTPREGGCINPCINILHPSFQVRVGILPLAIWATKKRGRGPNKRSEPNSRRGQVSFYVTVAHRGHFAVTTLLSENETPLSLRDKRTPNCVPSYKFLLQKEYLLSLSLLSSFICLFIFFPSQQSAVSQSRRFFLSSLLLFSIFTQTLSPGRIIHNDGPGAQSMWVTPR
ncbi:hypothetical protein CDAR_109361 [Caerostris darwini]|uniref:Uncharacterized protein n=1 Tax=Caerostris darwini TaxID=1538125 RepID=A0AAV4TVN4_9ARAC|nr:hypothetical protein CDAR_109361 [Caerostris darwini]